MAHNVHVIDHPLVQHKLTLLRKKETSTTSFRRLLNEIGSLMAYEVTRDLSMHEVMIETPLETMYSKLIDGKKLVFVPILRAGTGLLDGFLSVVPGARVGHVGLYRDPKSLVAVEYYFKMPGGMKERDARDGQLRGGRRGTAEGVAAAQHPLRVPSILPGGDRDVPGRASGRARLHGSDRPPAQRPQLHRPGFGRCRRPYLRHQVTATGDGRSSRS